MDYHETTLARYMDEVSKEQDLSDAVDNVLEEIEEKYPNILPEDSDKCYEIGKDIVINNYNIDNYMEWFLNEHNKENNNDTF